ncbi:hypothetical protein N836_15090 [Leptolyngbya sp. Heron Island J]|uniref:hypothetical protein n=1 Tax=Leptolyngbya sp. Heron Island J TaxID=1385935 RepID=UPI0003B9E2EF|nr:hypothetical protein [Leptolyngbya sp. Heron Island J]ESA34742.1 hypothetical protein N836_15090 [Leptolyngbya sp. Heron Island J]
MSNLILKTRVEMLENTYLFLEEFVAAMACKGCLEQTSIKRVNLFSFVLGGLTENANVAVLLSNAHPPNGCWMSNYWVLNSRLPLKLKT